MIYLAVNFYLGIGVCLYGLVLFAIQRKSGSAASFRKLDKNIALFGPTWTAGKFFVLCVIIWPVVLLS